MNEVILTYHIDETTKTILTTLMNQLDVDVKDISDDETNQEMGYLIGIPGYEKKDHPQAEFEMDQPFLFFAGFEGQQLDILLEIFKQAKMPYIPFKAMLTNDNVVYTFEQLYKNVKEEYESFQFKQN